MDGRQILPVHIENTREQHEAAEIVDVGHENQFAIDHFLDDLVGKIPEVWDDNVVRKGVLAARQGQHGKILESVMRDLCLLNMNDTPDDEEITTALCKYRRCRHILIDDETMKQMRDAEDDFKGGATQTDGHMKDIPTRTRTLGIPDRDETLEEFSHRHDKFCRLIEDIFIYDGELVQRSKISVQSLDNILGIAGFRPQKGLGLQSQTPKKEVSKEEVLNEIWDHIKIERIGSEFCAEVSLKPFSRFATQDNDMNDIFQHLATIISIYSCVGKVLEKLQSIGSLGNEIVYLKRRGAAAGRRLGLVDTEEADLNLADGFIIETVSLNMETLNELLATVNNFHDKFQKFSEKARANRGWFWSALAAVVAVGDSIALFLGLPGLIVLGVMALTKAFASGWGSATHDERMAAVSDFGEHARPILAQLQLPTVQISPISASMLQQDIYTLHKIALTGQFLSLILQSHVRGSKAPFDFEDLVDYPVSCFRLRGTDPNAASIFAFTQKLSCFPDQKVLVFDTTKINSSSGLQLQTTPAHMMILWQPIKVIIQTKDARDDGTSCSGLVAMGGIIIPNETPGTSPHLWRWSELQNLNAKMLCGRRMPGVGLHDRILIESYHDSDANQQEPGLIETLNPPMGHDADSEIITTASTAPSTQEQGTPVQATENFSLGTTIRASLQDIERDKVHLPRSATEGSLVSCPWDTDEAEAKRKSSMSECLG